MRLVEYLRRATGFDRANFWRRGSLRGVLLLWTAVTVLTVAAVALFDRDVIAVVATIVGGWLFARRHQRTRSLLVVSVEHALYGITIFTVGPGQYFYHGSGL